MKPRSSMAVRFPARRPPGMVLAWALASLAMVLAIAVPAAWAQEGGEGGEEATIPFIDPAGRFSFGYPQSWGQSTQPGEDIRLTGADEFISVAIVATDLAPLDYGESDDPILAASSDSYRGRPLVPFGASGAAVREYTWQAGPSLVSGKMVPSMAKRYYLPVASGTLAVFTYSSPVRAYDPEGADDFANGFRWLS